MIRQGNKTLHQVARRISEKQLCKIGKLMEDETEYPYLKKRRRGESGMVLHLETIILSSNSKTSGFSLTKIM